MAGAVLSPPPALVARGVNGIDHHSGYGLPTWPTVGYMVMMKPGDVPEVYHPRRIVMAHH
jgi:hypothetical protein